MAGRYEQEYLLELLAGEINQREVSRRRREPSWEQIYKMAAYHHVSNLVYRKILWMEGKELHKWKDKFAERYRSLAGLREKYKKAEERVEQALEEEKVNALFLGETVILPYYPRSDMRTPQPLHILTAKNKMDSVLRAMLDLGFEPEDDGERIPLHYRGASDVRIEFRHEPEFTDWKFIMRFSGFPKRVKRKENRRYIRELKKEKLYVYFVCRLAERYAKGQIEIRDMVDFWLLLKGIGHTLAWEKVRAEIELMGIEIFVEYLAKLAGAWFGGLKFPDEAVPLDAMQAYIFSKGQEARAENEKILPLINKARDDGDRF